MLAETLASEASDPLNSSLADAIRSRLVEPASPGPAADGVSEHRQHVRDREAEDGQSTPKAGGPSGPLYGPPTRRHYDPPSRRAPDVLFDAARAGVVGLFQAAVVLATLAGIIWLPGWWNALRDRDAAQAEVGRLVAENRDDGMIEALNRVMGEVAEADGLRLQGTWDAAGAVLASARSDLAAPPLSDCDGEAVPDPEPEADIFRLVCANRGLVERLVELEQGMIDSQTPLAAESVRAQWDQASDSIDSNSASVESLRQQTRDAARD